MPPPDAAAPAPRGGAALLGVAALYLAYLAGLLLSGTPGGGGTLWLDALAIGLTAAVLLRRARASQGLLRQFLLALAACQLPLLACDLSYGRALPLWQDASASALQLSDAAYLVYLAGWVLAWCLLALGLVRRRRPGTRTVIVFLLLMAGFVVLFAGFYAPLYGPRLGTLAGRVAALMAGLELVAVVLGLAAMLLGVGRALVLQVFGLTLLAAADMLYSAATVVAAGPRAADASADPVWMLGLCVTLAGALALPRPAGRVAPAGGTTGGTTGGATGGATAGAAAVVTALGAARRSGLSTLLLALSLGAVLLSAVVSLALRGAAGGGTAANGGAAPGEPFFFVLFVVALVALMVWLTDRFDHAVRYAAHHATHLLGHQLQAADWRTGDRRMVWILESTGLGALLDALHGAAARLRPQLLFLGPEPLNPPPLAPRPGELPSCFLVMPFGRAPSDAVHRVLRQACEAVGLRPLRGDDLFTPTDILDDIWRGITAAHCVIADISGRNPNVMYELGIAHTLAKPVLILAASADDIPIDLATRRVIVYDGAGIDEATALAQLGQRSVAALQALLKEHPPPRHRHGETPPA